MGLSCAVGTLVANSVVVLENIFRHKEQGLNNTEAASIGATEVIMAVLASTLTNVAVFLPLASMSGMVGQILRQFALTVVISTIFSIVVSFTITPLLASRMLPESTKRENRLSIALEKFFKKTEELYGASLKAMLKNKKRCLAVAGAVVAVFAFSLFVFTKLPMENMPSGDGGKLQIDAELPQGSSLDMTASLLKQIEDKVASYDEVVSVITTLGTMGEMESDVSVARVSITLTPRTERKRSNRELSSAMLRDLSVIPGADIRVSAPAEMTIMNNSSPIDMYVQGPDLAVLQQIGEEMKRRAAKMPGIMNAAISAKAGKQELVFTPNRKQISADGLTVQALAVSLRAAVDGLTAAVYRDAGQEYDIRVKMKDSALMDIEDIRSIPIQSRNGIFPLSRYAKMDFEEGYNQIRRSGKERVIRLTADLLPGYADSTVNAELLENFSEIEMPPGYGIVPSFSSKIMSESQTSLAIVFLTAIILVYMLLAAILENLVQPLYIISTVPLALIGVSLGCFITGTMLNILALISIVMLVGIVVNNAILLLDYSNQKQREGAGVAASLIEAGEKKLKAILMSNIAIILGNIPMALGIGASMAEMRAPMGVIIIGGIISSTVMTLWLIPCLEFLFKRKK
jgi:HAE1 family hydrophobic/amphiphilic exporter-1